MTHDKNDQQRNIQTKYLLDNWMIIFLLVEYGILLVIGSGILAYVLNVYKFSTDVMFFTTIASQGAGVGMCCVQYIRKLYKACINKSIEHNADGNLQKIGFFVYFLVRPLFASMFILLTISMIKAGVIAVTGLDCYTQNNKFLYICVMVASCIGFSVGRVMDAFEGFSGRKINCYLGDK